MGINIGAFLGQIVTGYAWREGRVALGVRRRRSRNAASVSSSFWLRAPKTLGPIGTSPARDADAAKQARQERTVKVTLAVAALLLLAVIVAAATGAITLNPQVIGQNMTYVLVGTAILYFAYIFTAGGLNGDEKKRVAVIMVLFIFAAIFWAAFEQAPTSLNLFANDFTDRNVGGFEMPATWFQSINSGFIILLAPAFAAIWVGMARRGWDLSSPAKFALGLVLAGIGFVLMIFAANAIVASGGTAKVSPWWLVWSYFFQTIGELCLSPVGLSSMTKLSPRKYVGQMMGIWFLATSVGNLIAGLVGGHVDPTKLDQTPKVFTGTTVALFAAAALCGLLVFPIRKMMGEAKH